MPRLKDVLESIKQRADYEKDRMEKIKAEMETLAESYNRFRDLKEEAERRQETIERLSLVFEMPKLKNPAPNTPLTGALGYSLWQVIETYLRFADRVRVGEIMEFLEWVKFTTTRQAVESAIATHNKIFRVSKNGREKFISLKEKAWE
jgi:hypothetical protein